MGASVSNLTCDSVYKVCSAPTENDTASYATEAKRQTIQKAKDDQKQETSNLKIISSLLKQSKDKQALYNQCIDPTFFELLYRGSTQGYKISSLHSLCDNTSNIFIIIQTDNDIFGFYSSKGFDSQTSNTYINDEHAFIFSIKIANKHKPEIFKLKSPNTTYALYSPNKHYIQIGAQNAANPDIYIVTNCNKSKGSFVYVNGSKKYFKTKEVLVYTVTNAYSENESDDNMSYADSNDYVEDDEILFDTRKFHIYVLDKHKMTQFKAPEYINDIDTESIYYGGCVIGNEWDETTQSNVENLSVDITKNLKKLKIKRKDCKVLVFVENKENGNKLEQINTNNEIENDNNYKQEFKKEEIITNVKDFKYKPSIPSISEHATDDIKIEEIELLRKKSAAIMDKKKQMAALRMKYSSRRVVLHGKNKRKTPKCSACNTYFHIQSDPINAYGGIGIVCDICNKNRKDNPEMVFEEHYYKCENCESVDICSVCYKKQKKALCQQTIRQD